MFLDLALTNSKITTSVFLRGEARLRIGRVLVVVLVVLLVVVVSTFVLPLILAT